MSNSLWLSSAALLLLSAPIATADDGDRAPTLKGPTWIEIQTPTWSGIQTELVKDAGQDGPARVHVQEQEGPAGWILLKALAEGEEPLQWDRLLSQPLEKPTRHGEYWLGVECASVGAALRAHLDLPEDQGLLVARVLPESPAAKAQLKQYDVLVKAGGKLLKEGQDLIDAVQQAKGEELSIELIRGGKRQMIKATPAKWPEKLRGVQPPDAGALDAYKLLLKQLEQGKADEATKRALEWLKKHQGEEGAQGPLRWHLFGPGAILPRDTRPRPRLPGNMSISITRQGDQPVKITVKQDGEKWEVTEDELDKLPEKVRPHVERMLGRHRFDLAPNVLRSEGSGPAEDIEDLVNPPEGRLEKRLEEMNRRIEQLRKSIDDLRERRPRLRRAPREESSEGAQSNKV